jgi:hypothetical protein
MGQDDLKKFVSGKAASETAPNLKLHEYGNRILLHVCTAFILSEQFAEQGEAAASK